MGLNSLFKQRKIGNKHTSISAHIPLRTPSGSQATESQLETDLVIQLNFSPSVYDLITQPIIEYKGPDGKDRQYTPDVFVELFAGPPGQSRYLMIEAKPVAKLEKNLADYEMSFNAARHWCANNHAEFRVVTEREIRTPYLFNANVLSGYFGSDPDPQAASVLMKMVDRRAITVGAALDFLIELGILEHAGRAAIECAVANRVVACDLSQEFTDKAEMFNLEKVDVNMLEPILDIVWSSSWRSGDDGNISKKDRI